MPEISVWIPKTHRKIDHHLFAGLLRQILDFPDPVKSFFPGGVGVALLEGLGDAEGKAEVIDLRITYRIFGTAVTGDDDQLSRCSISQIESFDHFSRLRHLGDRVL